MKFMNSSQDFIKYSQNIRIQLKNISNHLVI
jgi:hypothetical protein